MVKPWTMEWSFCSRKGYWQQQYQTVKCTAIYCSDLVKDNEGSRQSQITSNGITWNHSSEKTQCVPENFWIKMFTTIWNGKFTACLSLSWLRPEKNCRGFVDRTSKGKKKRKRSGRGLLKMSSLYTYVLSKQFLINFFGQYSSIIKTSRTHLLKVLMFTDEQRSILSHFHLFDCTLYACTTRSEIKQLQLWIEMYVARVNVFIWVCRSAWGEFIFMFRDY